MSRPVSEQAAHASGPATLLRYAAMTLQGILLVAAGVTLVALIVPWYRAAREFEPSVLPPTMEAVDWHAPESSIYCIACHRQVAPAMAGLDVTRGHSQNVALNPVQAQAVADLGTVTGPGHTLICMSCHTLEGAAGAYMLADTLVDSALCQRCHPGHYAQGTAHDLRLTAPDEPNRLGITAVQGGPCSACHLAHSFAREIVPSPLDPDGYCVSCHADYRVAAAHARDTMEHPESHCLACHNPHNAEYGSFLRARASTLCLDCHGGFGGGVTAGMHPLGPVERPLPPQFIVASAAEGATANEITCLTCHAVHQAPAAGLLRLRPDANDLCLGCHATDLAAGTLHGDLPRHGQSPPMDATQRDVVAQWGTRAGPYGELLCLSCHRVHGAVPAAQLLAAAPNYGETCVACHPRSAALYGTGHDLRTNFPNDPNARGHSPAAHGACSACHLAHGYPRERVITAGDALGQCVTCHRADGLAAAHLAGTPDHPGTTCTDCHDPHRPMHGQFLTMAADGLCKSCHSDYARLAGGPHDRRSNPSQRWPAEALNHAGACLPCHVPHGGKRTDLFRFGGPVPSSNHDDVCLVCHADATWQADSSVAALHPQRVTAEHLRINVALVPTDEHGEKRMGCRTCHDPHGAASPPHLARVEPGEHSEALCLRCHVDKELMRYTGHSAERLTTAGFETESCKPCHAMHARPGESWGTALSPRFLPAPPVDLPMANSRWLPCLACHHAEGPAPVRRYSEHPPVIMMNINQPTDPGYLPLFDADGHEDAQGQVVCRTCHLSHGRFDLLAQMDQLTPEQREAVRAQVRPFVAPNACTACHGEDARSKYLYFHETPLSTQPAPVAG